TATLFSLGVFFPDMVKMIAMIPGWTYLLDVPSHTPFGLIFACAVASQLFADSIRWRAFSALYLGSMTHLLLDLMRTTWGAARCSCCTPSRTRRLSSGCTAARTSSTCFR